jgi:urea transport system permease protein
VILGILNAISIVSILFVTTVGLALIFGVMGVVNLAHGEFLMIGAYVGFWCASQGLSPWFSLLLAPLVLGLLAVVIEPILIRFLYGKTMESILATWGLGIILRQMVEIVFGKAIHQVPYPTNARILLEDVQYPVYRIVIMTVAVLLAAAFFWVQRKTNLGVNTRAVMNNPALASGLGINVNRVYWGAFALGSAITGLGGALVAPLVSAYPSMGLSFVASSFLAILAGGTGSLIGLVWSSSLLGTIDSVVSYLVDPVFGSILFILVAVAVMTLKKSRA